MNGKVVTIVTSTLLNRAGVTLVHCLRLEQGEELLILTDESIDTNVLDSFKLASSIVKSKTRLLILADHKQIPEREYSLFACAASGKYDVELPRSALAALKESDATVILMSNMEVIFSEGLKRIIQSGRKVIFLPYMMEDEMLRLFPESEEEVIELKKTTERVGKILDGKHEAKVTSPEGTDIKLKLGDYPTLMSTGVVNPMKLTTLPGGQVSRTPNDESANGVIVIDRSIAAQEHIALHESITLDVENGNVVRTRGGKAARALERFLQDLEDPNIYHLTELGVGTNSRCKFAGIWGPSEETHTLGTVSFALGCDVHRGGRIRAKRHIDFTMNNPSLTLDGEKIVENGRLKF